MKKLSNDTKRLLEEYILLKEKMKECYIARTKAIEMYNIALDALTAKGIEIQKNFYGDNAKFIMFNGRLFSLSKHTDAPISEIDYYE